MTKYYVEINGCSGVYEAEDEFDAVVQMFKDADYDPDMSDVRISSRDAGDPRLGSQFVCYHYEDEYGREKVTEYYVCPCETEPIEGLKSVENIIETDDNIIVSDDRTEYIFLGNDAHETVQWWKELNYKYGIVEDIKSELEQDDIKFEDERWERMKGTSYDYEDIPDVEAEILAEVIAKHDADHNWCDDAGDPQRNGGTVYHENTYNHHNFKCKICFAIPAEDVDELTDGDGNTKWEDLPYDSAHIYSYKLVDTDGYDITDWIYLS